jgi:hypothetical protein
MLAGALQKEHYMLELVVVVQEASARMELVQLQEMVVLVFNYPHHLEIQYQR